MRSLSFVGRRRGSGIQFVTLFSLVIAIILFRVPKISRGQGIGGAPILGFAFTMRSDAGRK